MNVTVTEKGCWWLMGVLDELEDRGYQTDTNVTASQLADSIIECDLHMGMEHSALVLFLDIVSQLAHQHRARWS